MHIANFSVGILGANVNGGPLYQNRKAHILCPAIHIASSPLRHHGHSICSEATYRDVE